MASPLSLEVVTKIVERYQNGEHGTSIARDFGIGDNTVYKWLRKQGCEVRPRPGRVRMNSCNDNYFHTIDDPHKAYWLGFLFADGCVKRNGKDLHINLQIGDIDHLQRLREDLSATNEVKVHKGKRGYDPIASLLITSKDLCDGLIRNGVIPRKSLILKPPTQLEPIFIPHFIRGYFDGDGSISGRGRSIQWSLVGTKELMDWIRLSIVNDCGISMSEPHHHRKLWYLSIKGARKLTALRSYFYPQGTHLRYLPRKWLKFQEVRVRRLKQVES